MGEIHGASEGFGFITAANVGRHTDRPQLSTERDGSGIVYGFALRNLMSMIKLLLQGELFRYVLLRNTPEWVITAMHGHDIFVPSLSPKQVISP